MTTRRAFFFAALFALASARATGLPETKPLQVTYYFLPG
jgi:hypothetical protein